MSSRMIRSARAAAKRARRCNLTLAQRSPALAAWGALLLVPMLPAVAETARSGDLKLARCISETAAGRKWVERTLWGLHDQEGGWAGAEVLNSNGSHDLGPLQVNSWWVPRLAAMTRRPAAHVRWWLIHDPCFNVRVALWIFLSGLRATGDYWKAVGIYHSPSVWRQRGYVDGVAMKLRRRFGSKIFEQTAAQQNDSGQTISAN